MKPENAGAPHHRLSQNRIPVEKAAAGTKLWREMSKSGLKGFDETAFFIPHEDLKSLVEQYQELGATGARAYLAIEMVDVHHHVEGRPILRQKPRVKLYMVPANERRDFYNKFKERHPDSAEISFDEESVSSVYDFTMPCPNSCAEANRINDDHAQG